MLFTEARLRQRAAAEVTITKSAEHLLKESRDSGASSFDVFLSHSILDAQLVLGAKLELEDQGLTVYVDWLCDRLLDRTKVNSATAAHLRLRMNQCKMLVYVHSENAALSKWCPWELGYFDGLRGGNVFIFPVVAGTKYGFEGQEYLGLYPYLTGTDGGKVLLREADGYAYVEGARERIFKRA